MGRVEQMARAAAEFAAVEQSGRFGVHYPTVYRVTLKINWLRHFQLVRMAQRFEQQPTPLAVDLLEAAIADAWDAAGMGSIADYADEFEQFRESREAALRERDEAGQLTLKEAIGSEGAA